MKQFDPTKPCTTRDKRKVEILTTKRLGTFPILANIDGEVVSHTFKASGSFNSDYDQHHMDLINTPTEPRYRPYTPQEAAQHVGEKIKKKNGHTLCGLITLVTASGLIGVDEITTQELLDGFTYLDGTPCGVEESQ